MTRLSFDWRAALAVFAAAALGGLLVYGLIESRGEAAHDRSQEPGTEAARQAPQRDDGGAVTLDAAAERNDGIETAALHNAPHQEQLRAYGAVLDVAPLSELANNHAEAKAQLDIELAKLAASGAAFERARKLFHDRQNISAAELQAAEAAFRVDEARVAAARSRLRTIAVTAQQNWGAALGQAAIDGAPSLQRLIARQDVLIQVTLRPGQVIAEPPGDAAVILDNGSRAFLHFISTATKTDPRLQGRSFFFAAPGDSGLLAGIGVVALLPAGPPVEGAEVPASAIVWREGRAWAYFRTGPGSFARRAITTDRRASDGGGYIVQGIPDNTAVVVAGAQMLLSEEFRGNARAAPEGDQD